MADLKIERGYGLNLEMHKSEWLFVTVDQNVYYTFEAWIRDVWPVSSVWSTSAPHASNTDTISKCPLIDAITRGGWILYWEGLATILVLSFLKSFALLFFLYCIRQVLLKLAIGAIGISM